MKIVCDTTFIHGRDRFEKDDQRTVDDETGAYFIEQGWAHAAGEVTLDVHSSTHNQKVTHG